MNADELVDVVHRRLIEMVVDDDAAIGEKAAELVQATEPLASPAVVDDVVARVIARVEGLGPIEPLLADPSVSEVMVNGPGPVWVERDGVNECTSIGMDRAAVDLLVERVIGPLGRRIDQRVPYVDGRLDDGSRIHVVVPPIAVDGPYVTIRRFVLDDVELERFAAAPVVALLEQLVERGANIVVSGGTGAGKTTLLNALARRINRFHRVITIEDAAELRLMHPHVVRLESRPPSREGGGEVTIRELVRNSLRMRPDRLVVGEVRGREALDLLHALNTGHAGCLSTIHANGPVDALRRVATLAAGAEERVPLAALHAHVASAVDVVVHVERTSLDVRRLASVAEVESHDRVQILADHAQVHGRPRRPPRLPPS